MLIVRHLFLVDRVENLRRRSIELAERENRFFLNEIFLRLTRSLIVVNDG